MSERIDIAVIGAGPAGLNAGLYASRARLAVTVFDRGSPGGQVLTTSEVENYLGFESISGPELALTFETHARNSGTDIRHFVDVEKIIPATDPLVGHEIVTGEGSVFAGSVIIVTGASPNKLGVPGEEQFAGRGVSYCATCDGNFFRGKNVAVIGGGDTAVEDALYLSHIVGNVTVVHRRDELRAQKVLQERLFERSNVEFAWNSRLGEVMGDDVSVNGVALTDPDGNPSTNIDVQGVFVAVGLKPNSSVVPEGVKMDDGWVLTDERMHTNIPGLFAAGDIRQNALKQISVSVGESAVAATEAGRYLDEIGWDTVGIKVDAEETVS